MISLPMTDRNFPTDVPPYFCTITGPFPFLRRLAASMMTSAGEVRWLARRAASGRCWRPSALESKGAIESCCGIRERADDTGLTRRAMVTLLRRDGPNKVKQLHTISPQVSKGLPAS